MAKRIADKELTDRNWDQEDEGEEVRPLSCRDPGHETCGCHDDFCPDLWTNKHLICHHCLAMLKARMAQARMAKARMRSL